MSAPSFMSPALAKVSMDKVFSFAKVDSSSSSSSSAAVAKPAVSEEVVKVKEPSKHKCEFDFKKTGRDLILKANPVFKTDKVNRI
nr:zinc finger A20 and AN1 domain-containing stress-associated protein 7-like [Tanacetum cinerariifolium]